MVSATRAEPGTLYIVPTPIGNLGDMVPRAVEILQTADLIAAEDTRHSAKLLQIFNIHTQLTAFHDHNEQHKVQFLIEQLQAGKSIALISDAGTPLISDPGFRLVYQARQSALKVVPIPGACALVAALSASGLPSDKFVFEGFLPAKTAAREKLLQALVAEPRTLIFYESPHRIVAALESFVSVWGAQRELVLAREISKTFETFLLGSCAELLATVKADSDQQRGEMVILARGYQRPESAESAQARQILSVLLEEQLPVKQAASIASRLTGEKKNRLYQLALTLSKT